MTNLRGSAPLRLSLSFLVCLACSPKGGESGNTANGSDSATETGDDTSGTTAGSDGSSSTNATTDGSSDGSGSDSSSSDPTTSSSSSDSETGNEFIVPKDGGISGQCDPLSQDCPEGEKCTAVSMTDGEPWEINVCKPINGTGQLGDTCDIEGGKYTGVDDCDLGYICLLSDDEGMGGTCVEFCDANMNCPNTGVQCQVYNNGSLPICLFECDPLLQDCADGQGCYNGADGSNFVCFKVTAEPGEGQQGDTCNFINQCLPGLYCANAGVVFGCPPESGGCCTPYCDLSEQDPNANCQDGEQCVAYYDPPESAPPKYVDVGVCIIPE